MFHASDRGISTGVNLLFYFMESVMSPVSESAKCPFHAVNGTSALHGAQCGGRDLEVRERLHGSADHFLKGINLDIRDVDIWICYTSYLISRLWVFDICICVYILF